jgi:hypothetical protein
MSSIESPKRPLAFGAGAFVILGALGALLWLRKHHAIAGASVASVGAMVLFLSLAAPAAALAVRAAWMRFAGLLGFVNSRIILTIVFFVLLTPIALIRRLLASDPLQTRRHEGTYWRDRKDERNPDHYDHPY